jgi:hypothetical protein
MKKNSNNIKDEKSDNDDDNEINNSMGWKYWITTTIKKIKY